MISCFYVAQGISCLLTFLLRTTTLLQKTILIKPYGNYGYDTDYPPDSGYQDFAKKFQISFLGFFLRGFFLGVRAGCFLGVGGRSF